MAVNKPVGDNARKVAVKKRSQLKTKIEGEETWTKRSRASEALQGRAQGTLIVPEEPPDRPSPGEPKGRTPAGAADHFMKCPECGACFDMRDLGAAINHSRSLPHPLLGRER